MIPRRPDSLAVEVLQNSLLARHRRVGGVRAAAVYHDADPIYRASQVDLLTKHFGGSPEEYPDRYAAITCKNVTSTDATPPVLVVFGNRDHYVPYYSTQGFVDDMNAKGIENKVVEVPFSDHIFDLLPGNIGAQVYEQDALAWFDASREPSTNGK